MALREIDPKEWPSILQSDPGAQQVLKQYAAAHPGGWGSPVKAMNQYLATKGLQLPNEWGLNKNTGQLYEPSLTGWDAFTHVGLPLLGTAITLGTAGPALLTGAGAVKAGAAGYGAYKTATSGQGGQTVGPDQSNIVQGDGGPGGGGPGSTSILDTAGKIGRDVAPILGGAAAGANQSQQANDLLQLRGAQLGLEAPQQRLNTSVRASIAANAKPVQITTGPSPFAHAPAGSTMPHFTNSLSPALLSPDTRALAQSIIAQQLQEQMSPNHGLPEVGKVGTAGKILGGAALGSSILGTLPSILKDVRGIGNNPSGINVTGNYNAGDYVGVNPDTGLYDPNYDPSASQIPEVPIDWSGVGSDTGGNF